MEWKRITWVGDGRFIINENGEIINTITNNVLTPYITNKGYKAIDLYFNGIREKWLVHRLVAMAFLPNPNNFPVVLHLDDNRLNCSVSNLKWGTYLENNKQAIDEGHMKVPRPDNRKFYRIYYGDYDEIVVHGIKEAIDELGFGNDSCIRNYIFRDTPIPRGEYKGYKIELFDIKR